MKRVAVFGNAGGGKSRLVGGLFVDPPDWPAGSPLWSSTLQSYRVLLPCHRKLTPRYRRLTEEMAGSKRVHHLTSRADIAALLRDAERAHAARADAARPVA